VVSDNLSRGTGHYLKFVFDNNGIIRSVVYLGSELVSISSLVSLIGISESYLNRLVERFEGKLIENITEFLSENWAIALYHEWFSDFRFNLKLKLTENPEISRLMREVSEEAMNGDGYLTRDLLQRKTAEIPEDLRQLIRVPSSSSRTMHFSSSETT
jgi:hypothetical protein